MDQYVIALILGVIEGITECIPVSSTGHMIIIGHMLNFEGTHADVFEVFNYGKGIFVVLESILFILLWVLSDNSGYISNYLSLSMIANEEKMKFKKFRKNTCIGYRFMLL